MPKGQNGGKSFSAHIEYTQELNGADLREFNVEHYTFAKRRRAKRSKTTSGGATPGTSSDDEEDDCGRAFTSCVVESEAGREFELQIAKCGRRVMRDHIWVEVIADGHFLDAKYWPAHQRSIAFDQATIKHSGKKLDGPLQFAVLAVTDDAAQVTIDPDHFESLGYISIGLWKCSEREFLVQLPAQNEEGSDDDDHIVLEELGTVLESKARLSMGISIGGNLLPLIRKGPIHTTKLDSSKPFYEFHFQYASRARLELDGIIPRLPELAERSRASARIRSQGAVNQLEAQPNSPCRNAQAEIKSASIKAEPEPDHASKSDVTPGIQLPQEALESDLSLNSDEEEEKELERQEAQLRAKREALLTRRKEKKKPKIDHDVKPEVLIQDKRRRIQHAVIDLTGSSDVETM